MAIEFTIREATDGDAEAIRQINLRAWSGHTTHQMLEQRHGVLNGTPWTERIADAVANNLRSRSVTTFVAAHEGRVIGFASAQINRERPSDIGIVGYNAVDPDHRRQGVGKALIRHVVEYLREQGARVLTVCTLQKGEAARRMYEGLGFREFTRMIHYSIDCRA